MMAFFVIATIAPSISAAQEDSTATNELNPREFEIIGKDTRAFKITGDRISAIEFVNFPVSLPQEERERESSKGLIKNEERLFKNELFSKGNGHFACADLTAGSNTWLDLWGKASLNRDNKALSIGIMSRYARENTPANSSPVINSFDATGSLGKAGCDISAKVGFINESSDIGKNGFRPSESNAQRFFGMGEIRKDLYGDFKLLGGITLKGGTFEDKTLDYDKNEQDIKGNLSVSTKLFDIEMSSLSMLRNMKMGGTGNTLFQTGLFGNASLLDNLGLDTGISLYYCDPEKGTKKSYLSPSAQLNWDFLENSSLKLTYNPEIKSYSFGDIHDINGLVLPDGGIIKRELNDLSADLTLRIREKLSVSPGFKYTNTLNALVFSRNQILLPGKKRKSDFFDIVPGAHTKIASYSLNAIYYSQGNWGMDSDFTVNDGQWNKDGDVPFLSDYEFGAHCYASPIKKWLFHCYLRVFGEHHVETSSGDKTDPFAKIDLKAETDINTHLNLNLEIRNITNSKGYWWTERYIIPGVGLFAGLSTKY